MSELTVTFTLTSEMAGELATSLWLRGAAPYLAAVPLLGVLAFQGSSTSPLRSIMIAAAIALPLANLVAFRRWRRDIGRAFQLLEGRAQRLDLSSSGLRRVVGEEDTSVEWSHFQEARFVGDFAVLLATNVEPLFIPTTVHADLKSRLKGWLVSAGVRVR